MKIKHFCLAVALTSISSAASVFSPVTTLPAKALTWTLNNVQFKDGGFAVGSFDYDRSISSYTSFNIDVENPEGQRRNFSLSDLGPANDQFFILFQNDAQLSFGFDPLLDDTGGTRNLVGGGYVLGSFSAPVAEGSVTASTAVPFEFDPNQGLVLGVPLFIGLRVLQKKLSSKRSRIKVSVEV